MIVDLSTVIVEGLFAALPAFGLPGRIYFATDTQQIWYDTGTAWVNVSPAPAGSAQTTVAGSVSGSAVFSQPFGSAFYKKVVAVLEALDGTAAYVFPTAFTQMPDYLIGTSAMGATVTALSTAGITISGLPSTGVIILEGF
jgi:hypothetical protein